MTAEQDVCDAPQDDCCCGSASCECECGGYALDPRAAALMDAITAAWQQAHQPIDEAPGCITCSDEGRPGVVVGPGRVRTELGEEDVDLTLTPQAAPGDRVLVHAGMAITVLDPQPEGEPA